MNLCPTQQHSKQTEHDTNTPINPHAPCEMYCMAALVDYNKKTIYTDATGRFPVCAHNGSQYALVTYVYDDNMFLVCPLQSRPKDDMNAAIEKVYQYLCERNMSPALHILDNECAKDTKSFIKKQQHKYTIFWP